MFACIDKGRSRAFIAALILSVGALWVKIPMEIKAKETAAYEWGLHFEKPNTRPVPNLSAEDLAPYNAYYRGNTDEKVLYLTFDAGYENGYTRRILDTLKKHNAPAAFFLVGPYIKSNPELVKRMTREGHTVGNHSYNHPDMTNKNQSDFLRELSKTNRIYKEVTGESMPMFYRPPEGKFSNENLTWAKNAGYTTVFWSVAYVDWDNNNQPSHSYAYEKLDRRTFPGAIILLHSTSKTNSEILDTQLTKWKEAGYRIAPITELSTGRTETENQ